MAQNDIIMFSLFKDSYRLMMPGYDPGPGLLDGTIGGLGKVMVDVLVGEDKALVWDTGYGDVDLKGFIRKHITDKPLIVVNSHGHPDHCVGNGQFEQVWIKREDVEIAKMFISRPIRPLFEEVKNGKFEFLFLEDYQEFDLGNRKLKVIPIPGHTMGCVGLLDCNNRVLYSGDSILKRTQIQNVSSAVFRNSLHNTNKLDFDCILSGHWEWPLEHGFIDIMIKLIDDFTPDKAVVCRPFAHIQKPLMTYTGNDYPDPNFAAIGFGNVDTFMGKALL